MSRHEPWLMFYDKASGKELCAYTVRGTFPGEIQETKALLAYENGLPTEQVGVKLRKEKTCK